jgi:transporter family protein
MGFDHRVALLSGLTILLWGFWGFAGKVALERRMPPTSVFLAEVFISALAAAPVLVMLSRTQGAAPLLTAWNVFGLASGAGLALGLLCYYLALERSHASILVPLTALYPAVSVILSFVFLSERPTGPQWVGVGLAIAATILLLTGPTTTSSHE